MNFEFRKLYRNKLFKISIFLILIYIAVISFKNINARNYYVYRNDGLSYLTGLSATKAEKKDRSSIYGKFIDEEFLSKYLSIHKDVISGKYDNLDDTSRYAKYEQKYNDIMILIAKSYAPFNSFDLNIADTLSFDDLDTFYTNRKAKLNTYLDKTEFKNYKFTDGEKNFLLKENDKLKTPIEYTYYKGWEILLSDFFISSILFAIFSNVVVSNTFTMDYSNNMNEILFATVGKKRIIKNKIKSGIWTGALMFLLPHLLYAFVILLLFGIDGFNAPIQLYQAYWNSVYNLTFLQAYLLILMLGVLITVISIIVNMIVSIISKKSLISVSIVLALNFIPLVLYEGAGRVLKKILSVSMINLYNGESLLINYRPIFRIFNIHILQAYAMVPICLVIIIIFSIILNILAIRNYENYK